MSRVAADRGREWFETLFSEHFDRVLRYALLRADADTAREVASQTFLVAWRRRADIGDPVVPWLLVVARNVLAEQRRAAGRRKNLLEKAAGGGTEFAVDPAQAVADRDAVVVAFLDLPESDREVLRLHAWDGLTNEEGATVVGCSAGAFAVRLSRARHRLEARLAVHEAELPPRLTEQLEAR